MVPQVLSKSNHDLAGQTGWCVAAVSREDAHPWACLESTGGRSAGSPQTQAVAAAPEADRNAALSRETELVARILAGDREAFAAVERTYGAGLRRLVRRQFQFSISDSEDIVHDMLIALMENDYRLLRTYRGHASLGTWLRAVVRRRCLDRLRRVADRQKRLIEAAADSHTDYDADNHFALHEALNRLSLRDRALVHLFFFDGRSQRDIAQALDLSENTVASYLFRVKERLRTMLSPPS